VLILFIVPKNSGLAFCRDVSKEKFKELRQIIVRGEDVPSCVNEMINLGKKTIGITGEDLFLDYKLGNPDSQIEIIEKIPWTDESAMFGKPTFCLLGPKGKEIKDLPKKVRICANKKYKNIVEKYLVKLKSNFKLDCTVMYLGGATEEAFEEGLCELVIEIVYSGKSINECDLEVYEKIIKSDLVVIGEKKLETPNDLDFEKMNGLIPTVVKNTSGNILMLAYSNKDSLTETVNSGCGCYYSRSRQELWKKGATSGNTQKVLKILSDCDGDALEFIVEQKGLSCHTGNYSCFGETLKFDFERLIEIIKSKKSGTDLRSFTKKLLDDEEFLNSKITEESIEVIGAKNRFELTWELADVMYFLLVKMVSSNIGLEDVFEELQRRNKVFK